MPGYVRDKRDAKRPQSKRGRQRDVIGQDRFGSNVCDDLRELSGRDLRLPKQIVTAALRLEFKRRDWPFGGCGKEAFEVPGFLRRLVLWAADAGICAAAEHELAPLESVSTDLPFERRTRRDHDSLTTAVKRTPDGAQRAVVRRVGRAENEGRQVWCVFATCALRVARRLGIVARS